MRELPRFPGKLRVAKAFNTTASLSLGRRFHRGCADRLEQHLVSFHERKPRRLLYCSSEFFCWVAVRDYPKWYCMKDPRPSDKEAVVFVERRLQY
jgi:hypothetical protein